MQQISFILIARRPFVCANRIGYIFEVPQMMLDLQGPLPYLVSSEAQKLALPFGIGGMYEFKCVNAKPSIGRDAERRSQSWAAE
jgi:hypothetical protein